MRYFTRDSPARGVSTNSPHGSQVSQAEAEDLKLPLAHYANITSYGQNVLPFFRTYEAHSSVLTC